MTLVRVASLVPSTPTSNDGSWGSTGYLRLYSSQNFYSSENVYVNQGRPGTDEWCQQYTCPIDGDGFITLPVVSMYSTTDSSVQNAVYTAQLYDSAFRLRSTFLANFYVDPNGLQVTAESSVLVSGAGSTDINGVYTFRGVHNGKGYYNLTGFSDSVTVSVIVAGASTPYVILDTISQQDYVCLSTTNYPWEDTYDVTDGIAPPPTVAEDVTVISTTWEAITASNQGQTINFFNSPPTWSVPQIKGYVQSVIASGSSTFASATIPGVTKLDVDPVLVTSPIAIGTNSPIISDIETDITTLQGEVAGLAPLANPTFTGTVNVTGNIIATTTIHANGNMTAANLSGNNTGDQTQFDGGTAAAVNKLLQLRRGTAAQWTSANPTLASGEEGLETDTRKTKIGDGTTNWVGLAYTTNATTLTGDVTGTGTGSIATTISALAVTNGMLAGSIDQAKLAGSIPFTKLVGSDIVITESQVTNLVSDLALKANLVNPVLVGPALGTIVSGVLTAGTVATQANGTNDTTIASTAFVQSLGSGAKVYQAVISQSSTSAPTAQVLTNFLGMSVNFARTSAGLFTATSASGTPFTSNKTQIIMGSSVATPGGQFSLIRTTRTSTTVVTIETLAVDVVANTVVSTDSILSQTSFTIIVWP